MMHLINLLRFFFFFLFCGFFFILYLNFKKFQANKLYNDRVLEHMITAVCYNAQGKNLVLGTGKNPLSASETILINEVTI